MKRRIELNFSHQFNGTIWKSALSHSEGILLLEVRNGSEKKTTFSAVNLNDGNLLWKDMTFEEDWWVGLEVVQGDVALFSIFTDAANPERKALIAYNIRQKKIMWWNNDLSLSTLGLNCILGVTTQYGQKQIALDLLSGEESAFVPAPPDELLIRRPSQYVEDHPYFITVRTFLSSRFNFQPVVSLEYLEDSSLIFVSAYQRDEHGLSNDLFVISSDGKIVLQENLGRQLKGIGQDTFFIYAGSVIFVRNRGELFSYKIV
ncbi:DUF4905 domain-containing protein [Chryseolinea sp. T2]|uniref:DUF4905 domain-containing protein n=1 Tax=Chryseolinea sp. T2 TaxID=3129255 RepID=UPI003077B11B